MPRDGCQLRELAKQKHTYIVPDCKLAGLHLAPHKGPDLLPLMVVELDVDGDIGWRMGTPDRYALPVEALNSASHNAAA